MAFRRDTESLTPQVAALQGALRGGESVVTTGLILQELLQGFLGARAHKDLVQRFAALLAQLCIRHDLTMLAADDDFSFAAKYCALRVWKPQH